MNNLLYVLLMAPQGDENPLVSLAPLVLIIAVFYFFMIRPQMKKQKDLKKFREDLKTGDKVITLGGIYGKIVSIKENAVILEIDNNVRVKVDKNGLIKDSSELIAQK